MKWLYTSPLKCSCSDESVHFVNCQLLLYSRQHRRYGVTCVNKHENYFYPKLLWNLVNGLCSYALFDKDGNQVPQQVVMRVGETFERILKEVFFYDSYLFFFASLLPILASSWLFSNSTDRESKGWKHCWHVSSPSYFYCSGQKSTIKVCHYA